MNQSSKSPSVPMPASESQEPSKHNVNSLQSTLKWRSPFGSPPARANAHASDNSSALYRLSPTSMKNRPHNHIWEDEDEALESENTRFAQEIEGKKSKTCEIDIGRIKGHKSDPLYVVEDGVDISKIQEPDYHQQGDKNRGQNALTKQKLKSDLYADRKSGSIDPHKRTLNIQDEYVYENSVSDQGQFYNSTSMDPLSGSRKTRDLIANVDSASLDRISKHLHDKTTSSHRFDDEGELPQSGGELDSDLDLDDSMQGLRGQTRKLPRKVTSSENEVEDQNPDSVQLELDNERWTGTQGSQDQTKDLLM